MGEIRQDETLRSRWRAVRDFVVEWCGLIGVAGALVLFVPAMFGQGVVRWIAWYPYLLSWGLMVVEAMRQTLQKTGQDPIARARGQWMLRTWGLRIALPGAVVAGVPCVAAALALPLLDDQQTRAVAGSPATLLVIVGLAFMAVGIGIFLLEAFIKDMRTDGDW